MENVLDEGFVGMKGDWRDTFGFAGTFRFRIITLDFIGRIIMHCHTLTHEDTGMMAWYQIVNVSNQNVYNNQSEWNKLCKYDIQKTLKNENKFEKAAKWCKNNKLQCGVLVGTGFAVAFV